MLNSDDRLLEAELVRIADDIEQKAIFDQRTVSWKTKIIQRRKQTTVVWEPQEHLYSGVAGILLFYLDLFRVTKSQKHLEILTKGSEWLINYMDKTPNSHYGFYTGRTGSLFLLGKLYELNGESRLLKAIDVHLDKINANALHKSDDLLAGTAGTVLGLLHIYESTKLDKCLQCVDFLIKRLLYGIYRSKEGVYWGHNPQDIKPLCGFSHGAAGMGYVFLELFNYFANPTFKWLAIQSFNYENAQYNEQINNWPDYRGGGFFNPSVFKEYSEEDIIKHVGNTKNLDFSAWCHGAPGIGLSRLRALELLKEEEFLKDVEKASKKTLESITTEALRNPTLCHGVLGNATLFIEQYRLSQDPEFLNLGKQIALSEIQKRNKSGFYKCGYTINDRTEDTSLFMGNAGIGAFINQVLNPTISSPLKPDLRARNTTDLHDLPHISFSIDSLKDVMLSKFNPWLKSIVSHKGVRSAAVLDDNQQVDLAPVNDLFTHDEKQCVNLEIQNSHIHAETENFAALHAFEQKLQVDNKVLASLADDVLLLTPLCLSPLVSIHELTFESEPPPYLKDDNDFSVGNHFARRSTADGVILFRISMFAYCILERFKTKSIVSDALTEVKKEFDDESLPSDIEKQFILQIRLAIVGNVLMKA